MASGVMIDFTDTGEGGALDQRAIDWLLGNGVTIDAIAMPWAVRSARVTFEPTGRYRPCSGLGQFAYIFAIIDDRILDLVAWSPENDRLATRLGRGGALGQGQLGIDGVGTTDRPLPVWRRPLDWLRASRRGVVIADSLVAAYLLAGAILQVENKAHAAEISDALRLPPPKLIFQARKIAA
jgi:hypothetical protein